MYVYPICFPLITFKAIAVVHVGIWEGIIPQNQIPFQCYVIERGSLCIHSFLHEVHMQYIGVCLYIPRQVCIYMYTWYD